MRKREPEQPPNQWPGTTETYGYRPVPVHVPVPQQPEETHRVREGAMGIVHFLWKRRIELAPPELCLALAGVAKILSKNLEEPTRPVIGGAAVVVAAMWWYAPRRFDRDEEVLYARWATVAAAVWMVAAVLHGTDRAMLWVLFLGGAGLAIPWWRHKLPRFNRPEPFLAEWIELWDEIANLPRVNLAGSRVLEAEGDESYAVVLIQLVVGYQTVQQVKEAHEFIAQMLRIPVAAVTSRPVEEDPSLVQVVIRKVMQISSGVSWDDDLAPRSFVDPLYLGHFENGEIFRRVLRGVHWKMAGLTQWGKSFLIQAIIANLSFTNDTVVIYIDWKNGNTARAWLKGLGWVGTTYAEACTIVQVLNEWINVRSASDMPTPHRPSPQRPAFVLIVDELGRGVGSSAPNATLYRLLETYVATGLGLGFHFIGTGQDGSLGTWGDEKLRGQVPEGFLFKVDKSKHGQYIVDDINRCNGAKIKIKGSYYFSGLEGDKFALIRGPHMNPDEDDNETGNPLAERILAMNAPHMAVPEPELIEAAGTRWSERWLRANPQIKHLLGIPLEASPVSVDEPTKTAHEMPAAEQDRQEGSTGWDRAAAAEADALPSRVVNIQDFLNTRGTVTNAAVQQQLDDTETRFCDLLLTAPRDKGITGKQLYEVLPVGRSYVTHRLQILSKLEQITTITTGKYIALPAATRDSMMTALAESRMKKSATRR